MSSDQRVVDLTPAHLESLSRIVGPEHVRWRDDEVERFSRDETERFVFRPAAAILPASTAEVAAILALASAESLPVTPRGAGTGLSGGALAVQGGLVLSLERMNRIRDIDERDLVAEVEAGVVTGDLQRRVEELGLFYPPDPSSKDSCQIGGNLAEDSAGPRSCKYGSTRKYVLGLEAVDMNGRIFRTGGRNRKDVAGYNLTQLLVGSEGTLAVITAATLRLIAKPKATLALLLPFPELEIAAAAVEAIFRHGFDPAACELLEERALLAVGKTLELPRQLLGHKAMLLLELDGDSPSTLTDQAEGIAALTEELGAGEAIAAEDEAEQRRLWAIRRKMGEAVKGLSVYKEADTVVPRSKLAELVVAARESAERQGLLALCYGHAGDGNLHVNILRGELDDATWERRRDAAELELFKRICALGGSITGEHGVGFTQRRFLPLAVDPVALGLMEGLKAAFDPRGLLNPGKIFLSNT